MTVFYWIIVRRDRSKYISEKVVNHEAIHFRQLCELTALSTVVISAFAACDILSWWWLCAAPFAWYIRYVNFWLAELGLPPFKTAYRDIAFEREAYYNETDLDYTRRWWRHLFGYTKYWLTIRERSK